MITKGSSSLNYFYRRGGNATSDPAIVVMTHPRSSRRLLGVWPVEKRSDACSLAPVCKGSTLSFCACNCRLRNGALIEGHLKWDTPFYRNGHVIPMVIQEPNIEVEGPA